MFLFGGFVTVIIISSVALKIVLSCPLDWCTCSSDDVIQCIDNAKFTNEILQVIARDIPSSTKELHITGTKLSRFSAEDFPRLSSLTRLYLFNNELTLIPVDLFIKFPALEILDLRLNEITTNLSKTDFNGLYNLKTILLDNNAVQGITGNTFSNTKSLETFSIQNNNLKFISGNAFNGAKKLQMLNVNHNRISHLEPGLFSPFQSSNIDLSFSNNRIKEIPNGLFNMLNDYVKFDLKHNLISKIGNSAFVQLNGFVQLLNNSIINLSLSSFEKISHGLFIMHKNDLNCSCEFYTDFAKHVDVQFIGSCKYPTRMQGSSVMKVLQDTSIKEACPICGRMNIDCSNSGNCTSIDRENYHCKCIPGIYGKDCQYDNSSGSILTSKKEETLLASKHTVKEHIEEEKSYSWSIFTGLLFLFMSIIVISIYIVYKKRTERYFLEGSNYRSRNNDRRAANKARRMLLIHEYNSRL